jgi:hypothetical protein
MNKFHRDTARTKPCSLSAGTRFDEHMIGRAHLEPDRAVTCPSTSRQPTPTWTQRPPIGPPCLSQLPISNPAPTPSVQNTFQQSLDVGRSIAIVVHEPHVLAVWLGLDAFTRLYRLSVWKSHLSAISLPHFLPRPAPLLLGTVPTVPA